MEFTASIPLIVGLLAIVSAGVAIVRAFSRLENKLEKQEEIDNHNSSKISRLETDVAILQKDLALANNSIVNNKQLIEQEIKFNTDTISKVEQDMKASMEDIKVMINEVRNDVKQIGISLQNKK